MILREMPDGRLLCINQTSHALMAAEFCRHWGNRDFACPQPYAAVMLGVAQHDNGWYEWEQRPHLRGDGYPMDFLHGPPGEEKIALWQRGVDRALAQHPYAGLLTARHAVRLYRTFFHYLPAAEQEAVTGFIDRQEKLTAALRAQWQADAVYGPALAEERLAANTHLVKFGDSASLRAITAPDTAQAIERCPVDGAGAYVDIVMTVAGDTIAFGPWPFAVESFSVSVHGRVLEQTHFADEAAYHSALAAAPMLRLTWQAARVA